MHYEQTKGFRSCCSQGGRGKIELMRAGADKGESDHSTLSFVLIQKHGVYFAEGVTGLHEIKHPGNGYHIRARGFDYAELPITRVKDLERLQLYAKRVHER